MGLSGGSGYLPSDLKGFIQAYIGTMWGSGGLGF